MDNPPKPGKQKKSPRSLPEAIPVASQGTPQHASRPAVKAPRRRWNPRTLLLLAGTAAAALIIPTAHRLLPDVSTRAEYIVSPAQITLSPPPHWIPADILQQTIDTAAKSGPLSLLDDSLTERIAAAFHTHPWVDRVLRVQKSWPTRVHVDLVWRRPVAMVACIDGFYPIDANGVLLPARDFAPADLDRYPVIENIASVPLGRVGEAWGDPVVEQAAALAAEFLNSNEPDTNWWQLFQLAAIVAPGRTTLNTSVDELEFQLRTSGGSTILWGRGPDSLHPGELSTERKLERLAEFTERFGPIDDAHGAWQLDIRPWQGIRRSLLAADPQPDRHGASRR